MPAWIKLLIVRGDLEEGPIVQTILVAVVEVLGFRS